MNQKRRTFTDYEKKTVYAKCNGKCAICGKPVAFKDMTVDHKIPLSKGGTNKPGNLQLSCSRCNQMKANMEGYEFIVQIKEILRYQRREKFLGLLGVENA